MSHNLWRYLLEDDVESFRQYLANATFTSVAPRSTASGPAGSASLKIGSPATLATSPRVSLKSRKSSGNTQSTSASTKHTGLVLTRADVNAKDDFGRTILHHAASLRSENAREFVKLLLEIPFIDLYAQDKESGWTPLHRALYFGNICTAQALMQRDLQDAIDYTTNTVHVNAGGLVKIKDNEGNSPFEVFGLTIAPRVIQYDPTGLPSGVGDEESTNSVDLNDDSDDHDKSKRHVRPAVDLCGDEVFAFGSNKNLTLGLGDEDDRHFPERLQFLRPSHLLWQLHEDDILVRHKASSQDELMMSSVSFGQDKELPALIRNKAITIQDVVMSKLHTAVLTNDPISNLHICGFGPGGRLGTGDESTAFNYKCIQGGGLAKRRIATVALGQDHTVAITSLGEVFTWGSNRYGQLGYALPEVSAKEIPMQLFPRQLYGYIKKELIIGAATSSIHSAVHTSTALYTFGKNEGQLGLMDADARSLELQILPRRVGPSILQASIRSVSAIDRATTVLLENHDVIVFTHFGWTKVIFQLEGFTKYFISDALASKYTMESNIIQKITSGGSTICARSSLGEVYTIEVPKVSEMVPSSVSTTNPTKARNALPPPTRVWSIKKAHMSAIDVAVGQDGSIILCTASGSVWRKEKRANIKSVRHKDDGAARPKDYKFVRVPNLTRAIAVRSNAFGAFTAVRKDCDVTREQIVIDPPSIWTDLFPLLPFHKYGIDVDDELSDAPRLRFWRPASTGPYPADIKRKIITAPSSEADLTSICSHYEPLADSQYDVWITSNVTDLRIPIHSFLLRGRSSVLRSALTEFQETYYYSIPDVMSIEYGQDGQIQIQFQGADFLTIANVVFYLYTDNLIDVWRFTSQALQSAARYRSVRTELMKIASHLEIPQLERAVRIIDDPIRSLSRDMEVAVNDADFFSNADVVIELSDGAEVAAHSALLCIRCPFFDGLFNGRAGGMWMSLRRRNAEDKADAIRVDLKHIDARVFGMVLRHIYADTGLELFEDVVTHDLDEFIDLVIEVMSAANELMIDRLAEICQSILGKFVTTRTVCHLLNTVAECSVNAFKHAAFEYICLNLESMLEHRLLDELDPELLVELDEVVHQNQLAFMPFSRSGRAQAVLLENYPELIEQLEHAVQRRIDAMRLRSRLVEDEQRSASYQKFRVGSLERQSSSPLTTRMPQRSPKEDVSPAPSPAITANDTGDDLPFDMDEDNGLPSPAIPSSLASPNIRPQRLREGDTVGGSLGMSPGLRGSEYSRSVESESSSLGTPLPQAASTPLTALKVSGFEATRGAWQRSPQQAPTADLRDIMEQASATGRVSGITQAIIRADVGPSKVPSKLSQKERKRQQQQLKTQADVLKQPEVAFATVKPETPQSPWQRVAPQRATSSSLNVSIVDGGSSLPQSPGRPGMTMRQTVAGSSNHVLTQQKQKIHSPVSPGLTPAPKPAPPQIQSIRHTPSTARSPSAIDARSSMADILTQQQTEKVAVREAVAKRSLQEIQQEQEFQQWWDNESRRVQEEEAQASTTANQRGKGGRGRGGGRRKGSGRGGPANAITGRAEEDPKPTAQGRHAGKGDPHSVGKQPGGGRREEPRTRGHGQGQGRARGL